MRDGVFVEKGPFSVGLATDVQRLLRFSVLSKGCTILCGARVETADLLYAGSGFARVKATVFGGVIFVVPDDKNAHVRLDIPELRHEVGGWLNEPSLTDLSPRPFGAVSPEIKAVMDYMNRNAIIREQAMLRSLGQR